MSQPPFPPAPQGPASPPPYPPQPTQGGYPPSNQGYQAPPVAPQGPPPPYAPSTFTAQPRHRDRRPREGAVTAGVWLIAIGLLFLVRDWAGWSWGEAWPLFVIAAGAASLVTSSLHRARLDAGSWSLLWPIAWIVIGVVLLAATTGNLDVGLGELVSRWWPVALILVGLWFLVAAVWPGRRRAVESLSLPLGPSPVASVKLSFGGGVLEVGLATPGTLVGGTFQGGVRYRTASPDSAELEPDTGRGWPMGGATFRWAVGLTGEKPLDLRLDLGASRATFDLSELLVRHLDLHSGAAETRVRLPRAAGLTLVRADTGAASLAIDVPQGVAARIRSTMALGRVDVDTLRFPRSADGWESADFGSAPNRVEMDIRGGVGSVAVR